MTNNVTENGDIRNKIVYLNFIMAVGIVLYHSNNVERFRLLEGSDYSYFSGLTNTIGTLSLGYFFMLSGFLLYKGSDSNSVKRKIRSRKDTLFIPFIIWNVVAVINHLLWHRTLPASNFKEVVEGFSFFPFDGPLWYMFCLLLLLIPFSFLSKISCKWGWGVLIVCSVILRYFSDNYLTENGDYSYLTWLKRFLYYIPMYSIGAYIGKFYGNVVMKGRLSNRVLSVSSFSIFLVAVLLQQYFDYYTRTCISIILPLLMWVGVGQKLFAKEPKAIFKISFWIYATHMLIGQLTLGPLQRLCTNIVFPPIGVFSMKVINAVLFSVVSYLGYSILKYLVPNRVMTLITGGRV